MVRGSRTWVEFQTVIGAALAELEMPHLTDSERTAAVLRVRSIIEADRNWLTQDLARQLFSHNALVEANCPS